MKEPYGEGVASHTDPESWRRGREGTPQALTGARAGRVLSREESPRGRKRGPKMDISGHQGRRYGQGKD